MGQEEVYEVLEEHPNRWFTSREIIKILGISQPSVNDSLKIMRKRGEVFYRVPPHAKESYRYKFKA